MKKLMLALGGLGLSTLIMGASPGIQMIELPGQNHKAFPCSKKNIPIKGRSACVNFNGYGGMKGIIFVQDYVIHCATGGTKGPKKKVTYVSWNAMGQCPPGSKDALRQ